MPVGAVVYGVIEGDVARIVKSPLMSRSPVEEESSLPESERVRVIAYIQDPDVIFKTLDHLNGLLETLCDDLRKRSAYCLGFPAKKPLFETL